MSDPAGIKHSIIEIIEFRYPAIFFSGYPHKSEDNTVIIFETYFQPESIDHGIAAIVAEYYPGTLSMIGHSTPQRNTQSLWGKYSSDFHISGHDREHSRRYSDPSDPDARLLVMLLAGVDYDGKCDASEDNGCE